MDLKERLKHHVTGAIERGEKKAIISKPDFDIAKVQAYYLEYLNDFLTVERFAEYHGMSVKDAVELLDCGRKLHNEYTDYLNAKHDPCASYYESHEDTGRDNWRIDGAGY